jgi:hypothetical protein
MAARGLRALVETIREFAEVERKASKAGKADERARQPRA